MTAIAAGNAAATGNQILLTAALVRLEDAAPRGPHEINTLRRPAIDCRRPL